ncbi:MAG: iron-sulfur cluster assembly accessory protein [Synechococcales bacterium]|nr:iron-sulfur cluster assembly accessory protein [Synechococcales bacterium]
MTINLTEAAELRLRTFLRATAAESPNPSEARGVRFAVKDGGCSGYQYDISIVNTPKPGDVVEAQGRLNVYVDAESARLLDGVLVDYLDGLTQSGFQFTNPNATGGCGCGQSFQAGDCTPSAVPCS